MCLLPLCCAQTTANSETHNAKGAAGAAGSLAEAAKDYEEVNGLEPIDYDDMWQEFNGVAAEAAAAKVGGDQNGILWLCGRSW